MKWYSIASTVLAATQLLSPAAAATSSSPSLKCTTVYASTPTKHVHRTTITKTSTVKKTSTVVQTSTTTSTATSTFTVTIASATTTIPTSPGFIPLTSASSLSSTSAAARRVRVRNTSSRSPSPYPSPSPSPYPHPSSSSSSSHHPSSTPKPHFPHSILCTRTITHTSTTTSTSTFLIGAYTGVTTTVTTHVPTATAYAACVPDNMLSFFHGQPLGGYAADHSIGICFTGGASGGSGAEPCMDAETCCAAAQRSGYSGFQFTNDTEGGANACTILAGGVFGEGGFVFYAESEVGSSTAVFGNTGYGNGVFGGAQT